MRRPANVVDVFASGRPRLSNARADSGMRVMKSDGHAFQDFCWRALNDIRARSPVTIGGHRARRGKPAHGAATVPHRAAPPGCHKVHHAAIGTLVQALSFAISPLALAMAFARCSGPNANPSARIKRTSVMPRKPNNPCK
jgi:hypothetical protein